MKTIPAALFFLGIVLTCGNVFATDFNMPSNCLEYPPPTGGASSDLATDGDPPIVDMYIPFFSVPNVPAEILSFRRGGDGNWQIAVNAPQTGNYYIQTVYTPFLQTFQQQYLQIGNSNWITLSSPTNGTSGHSTMPSLQATIGQKYANGFVEFSASVESAQPFSMGLDGNGNVTVYCVAFNPNGFPVTVYDADRNFVGTGAMGVSGTIVWDN
ncbi:hypothetical protein [Dickeya dianthicola]|uniref:hypothetical protein n=1 Tax=Dickeya dianthicola TaxID=204039 RepID=UPI0018694FD5|nr:hypothetical protein [Dickeya dianthicola]QOL15205.1 hypothetical protein HGI48_13940 [Dickeya dianthicola]